MKDAFNADEIAYWTKESHERASDVEAARARGDAPYLLAGAELRLMEAIERLAAMSIRPDDPADP